MAKKSYSLLSTEGKILHKQEPRCMNTFFINEKRADGTSTTRCAVCGREDS